MARQFQRKGWLIHGKSSSYIYAIWTGMKARCSNPKSNAWKDYGGRGITVCDRWNGPKGFPNFLADMGEPPPGRLPSGRAVYTLDRIDVDGHYEPGNCRWATWAEQANNRRNNRAKEQMENIQIRCYPRCDSVAVTVSQTVKIREPKENNR